MHISIFIRRAIKSRRDVAQHLVRGAVFSKMREIQKLVGEVNGLKFLIHDGAHNSDCRPGTRRGRVGRHWTAWGFEEGSNDSQLYMHLFEDGRPAKLGPDRRKVFNRGICDLLWCGEVGVPEK